jgi:2-aminoadipate transaminase
MFIWARVKKTAVNTSTVLPEIIRGHNVAYVPGGPFYATNPDHQTLRLNFTKSTMSDIDRGIKRLIQGFSRYQATL